MSTFDLLSAGALQAIYERGYRVPADVSVVGFDDTYAPYLTPHPYRGRPNEPYCANYTLRDMATLRETDLGELATKITRNAERIFGLRDAAKS